MEAIGIHTAPPVVDVAYTVGFQLADGQGARRQRQRALVVERTGPLPRGVDQGLELVVLSKAGHIRLEHSHTRHVQRLGRESSCSTEYERAGQMHHVRTEAGEFLQHTWQWHTDGEGVDAGHLDGWHAHDPETLVLEDFLLVVACSRGDHHRFMAIPAEVLQHTEDGVHHSIDVGEEAFSNDGYTHVCQLLLSRSLRGGIYVKNRAILP